MCHTGDIVNGRRSESFQLPCGGRQGDNLYPMIFAIVVQGLASLIKTFPIRGIDGPEDTKFLLGQFADDTTLGIGCDEDWQHYHEAITIFCDASGMSMSWDKSMGLWLGSNITTPPKEPPATTPNGLTFMMDTVPTRILGARMGTKC